MKIRSCILQLILLALFVSCRQEKEIVHYANGTIKLEAQLKNGIRHGMLVDYYEDGSIKSRGIWKNGALDGKVEHYYANGKLKEITFYEGGKANGSSEEYYENGQLFKKATKKNDEIVGEINFYHENGALKEKRIHDENGNVMYLAGYDSNAKMFHESFFPQAVSKPDTLRSDELYQIQLKFGVKPRYKTQLLTGIFDEQHQLVDTTAIIKPDAEDIYAYSFKPTNQGKDTLFIMISHLGAEKDPLIVNGIIVYHTYFVKP